MNDPSLSNAGYPLQKHSVLLVFKRWDVVLLQRVDLNQASMSQFLLYKDTSQNKMKYFAQQYLQQQPRICLEDKIAQIPTSLPRLNSFS